MNSKTTLSVFLLMVLGASAVIAGLFPIGDKGEIAIFLLSLCALLTFLFVPSLLRDLIKQKPALFYTLLLPVWLVLTLLFWGENKLTWPRIFVGQVGLVVAGAYLVYYGPYSVFKRWMKK